jgi:heat shock protein HslJ
VWTHPQTHIPAEHVSDTTPDLRLVIDAKHNLVARDGCNTLSGHADIVGDTITVTALSSTAIGCIGGDETFRTTLATLLSHPFHYSIDGDQLTLSSATTRIVYVPVQPPTTDPADLPGSQWQLQQVTLTVGGTASGQDVPTGASVLTFAVDGKHLTAQQHPSCHDVTAEVSVGRGTMTIKPTGIVATNACGDYGTPKVLSGAVTWTVDRDVLTIVRAGVGSLRYAAYSTAGDIYGDWTAAGRTFAVNQDGYTLTYLCGAESGRLTRTGSTVTFVDAQVTDDHSCPSSADAGDQAVRHVLSGTFTVTVSATSFTATKDGASVTFRRAGSNAASQNPNDLLDTTWRLDHITTHGSDAATRLADDMTVQFTGAPGFVVHYACVTESGQAIVRDGRLTLKVTDSRDALPCPSTASADDTLVRARLSGPLSWVIRAGDQLIVTNAAGDTVVFAG